MDNILILIRNDLINLCSDIKTLSKQITYENADESRFDTSMHTTLNKSIDDSEMIQESPQKCFLKSQDEEQNLSEIKPEPEISSISVVLRKCDPNRPQCSRIITSKTKEKKQCAFKSVEGEKFCKKHLKFKTEVNA